MPGEKIVAECFGGPNDGQKGSLGLYEEKILCRDIDKIRRASQQITELIQAVELASWRVLQALRKRREIHDRGGDQEAKHAADLLEVPLRQDGDAADLRNNKIERTSHARGLCRRCGEKGDHKNVISVLISFPDTLVQSAADAVVCSSCAGEYQHASDLIPET